MGVYTYALDKSNASVNLYCFAMYSTFCMLQLSYLAIKATSDFTILATDVVPTKLCYS